MIIQYMSDLHLEKNNKRVRFCRFINHNADVLVLCGDIGSLYEPMILYKFLKYCSKFYKFILYIPGNHEFYKPIHKNKISFEQLYNTLLKFQNTIPNLFILNRQCIIYGDYCIAGCILWSKLSIELPTYYKITDMTTSKYNKMNKKDVSFIKKMIKYCKRKSLKLIMLTHYPPSQLLMNKYKPMDIHNSLYYNNLDYLLNDQNINIWIYGHNHYNKKIYINNTLCISNQYGGRGIPESNFSKFKTITLV